MRLKLMILMTSILMRAEKVLKRLVSLKDKAVVSVKDRRNKRGPLMLHTPSWAGWFWLICYWCVWCGSSLPMLDGRKYTNELGLKKLGQELDGKTSIQDLERIPARTLQPLSWRTSLTGRDSRSLSWPASWPRRRPNNSSRSQCRSHTIASKERWFDMIPSNDQKVEPFTEYQEVSGKAATVDLIIIVWNLLYSFVEY